LSRKVLSYILGAVLFLILFAARPASHYDDPQHDSRRTEESQHADAEHSGEAGHGHGDEAFSPAEFIFDHILDSYEWHILSHKDFHLSIPLPVILYSES
jgi:F-type H+-transporting ATPase subunit a